MDEFVKQLSLSDKEFEEFIIKIALECKNDNDKMDILLLFPKVFKLIKSDINQIFVMHMMFKFIDISKTYKINSLKRIISLKYDDILADGRACDWIDNFSHFSGRS